MEISGEVQNSQTSWSVVFFFFSPGLQTDIVGAAITILQGSTRWPEISRPQRPVRCRTPPPAIQPTAFTPPACERNLPCRPERNFRKRLNKTPQFQAFKPPTPAFCDNPGPISLGPSATFPCHQRSGRQAPSQVRQPASFQAAEHGRVRRGANPSRLRTARSTTTWKRISLSGALS